MSWVIAYIIFELILLLLPIYVYDQYFWKIMIFGAIVQFFFVNRIERKVMKTGKSTFLGVFVFIFTILNFYVYDFRKEEAFSNPNNLSTAGGTIIELYMNDGPKVSARYYASYEYWVKAKRYKNTTEVKFWVWFNYKYNKTIKVEYVKNNPRVSRIHRSSLKELPNHDKLLK